MSTLYEPMLCIVLQGAKEVMIGDRLLRYDTASYFVASIEVPASGRVVQASPEKPYIAVSLALDCGALAALLPETPPRPEDQAEGFGIGPVTPELLDPWLRLLRLLDAPQDIKVLAPLLDARFSTACFKDLRAGCCGRSPARIAVCPRSVGRSAGFEHIMTSRCGSRP